MKQNSLDSEIKQRPVLVSKRKFRSYSEAYHHFAKGSKCQIKADSYRNPSFFSIKLFGPAAQVPALKNEKVQGRGFLRAEAKARLAVMTDLFQKACSFKVPQYAEKIPVFCLVKCAYRKNVFDEDNVATTIRDWLEPKFIRNKDRGWGVGVVPNDRMVKIYATKKGRNAIDCDSTEIYIWPYSLVKSEEQFFLEAILNKIPLT